MAESNRIGTGRCPVCASGKAHYTLSKKGLVCVTCNGCNFQGFARSERSDELLRANIAPAAAEAAPAEATPPAATAAPAAKVDQVETPPPAEKPRRSSFMFSL